MNASVATLYISQLNISQERHSSVDFTYATACHIAGHRRDYKGCIFLALVESAQLGGTHNRMSL